MKRILADSKALIARCTIVKPMWDEFKCDQCDAQGVCNWLYGERGERCPVYPMIYRLTPQTT